MVDYLDLVKIIAMILISSCIVVATLPFRWNAFRNNQILTSFANAFSGGLLLSIGFLHLMPEAQQNLNSYYKEQSTTNQDHFPLVNFCIIACFALLLFIEKIAFDHYSHQRNHIEDTNSLSCPLIYDDKLKLNENKPENKDLNQIIDSDSIDDYNNSSCDNLELDFKAILHPQTKPPVKLIYAQIVRKTNITDPTAKEYVEALSKSTPHILKIAVGIHAVFEGMAIGIQTNLADCLGITTTVVCHKWTEGLTLGIGFHKASLDLKTSISMIIIHVVMNVIGIVLGWILSYQASLIIGIFKAISAGSFLYAATEEVIVQEFSMTRYKWSKYCVFLISIGFTTSLYFIQQVTNWS